MNEIPAGKYQFLKNGMVEWQRKIIKQHLKPFRSHRFLPALIWFILFMIIANLVWGSFFMLYAAIAYVPIIFFLSQLLFLSFKLLAIRMVGRLLFQKMLDSSLTEEALSNFPTTNKDYIRNFKWQDFLNASDPLEYFLHSAEIDSEKKYKK